jgi:hypothetical protein
MPISDLFERRKEARKAANNSRLLLPAIQSLQLPKVGFAVGEIFVCAFHSDGPRSSSHTPPDCYPQQRQKRQNRNTPKKENRSGCGFLGSHIFGYAPSRSYTAVWGREQRFPIGSARRSPA